MIILAIPIIILIINIIRSKKLPSREKLTPFECGFDPISISRIPISIQFFLVGLIFLIFDVEITLLIPLIFIYKKFNIIIICSRIIFLIILNLGLIIEYIDQTIEWKI